jgi:membrane protein
MGVKEQVRGRLDGVPGGLRLARLLLETTRICLRYRVTGLASEAGFFMLLSLPPLLLGLFGGVGYVGQWLGPDAVARAVEATRTYASQFLTASSIDEVLVPTIDDVLAGGRPDLISLGFLLSFWSGSRALNVFVDTISIMYGQSGERGIIRTRALSLALYSLGVVVAVVVLPLVLLGPAPFIRWLPEDLRFVTSTYWPVVIVLGIVTLTTLYHIATPRRAPWWRNLPGTMLALAIWVLASFVVRTTLEASLGGSSIYGPLSTPIVLLIWLYALAIAILVGAGLNAATRVLWPVELHDGTGTRIVAWARDGASGWFSRAPEPDAERTGEPEDASDEVSDEEVERQYARRERGVFAQAVDREIDREEARDAERRSRQGSHEERGPRR